VGVIPTINLLVYDIPLPTLFSDKPNQKSEKLSQLTKTNPTTPTKTKPTD